MRFKITQENNFGMAAYTALIPDQVKEEKQGTISGLLGMSLPLGIVVGMVLMTLLPDVSSAAKWTLIAAIGIVGPMISLFLIQEGKVEIIREHNTVVPLGEKLSKIYPSPRRFPAFSWAVASKFLMMMGYCSSLYLTVMLVNRMGYTEAQATSSVATVNIISTIAMALTSIFGGMLSDKFRKQKPFLYVSAFDMVIAILVFAFVPNYTAYVIASAVLGLGFRCLPKAPASVFRRTTAPIPATLRIQAPNSTRVRAAIFPCGPRRSAWRRLSIPRSRRSSG
uniref:MFS transporter n=1 Tax=Paenibacillus sp. FSL W8-0194 TaxID=2921711 RepID=UPI00403EE2CB